MTSFGYLFFVFEALQRALEPLSSVGSQGKQKSNDLLAFDFAERKDNGVRENKADSQKTEQPKEMLQQAGA